ncbi:MFS transporter [Bacillus sp. Marseille-P3661]|uniref:MFS transporter n=1 Tax=Bacillus sp. Marseille-P3661 TaxID=1936234 RepID=UPI000C840F18|nr:MFS transporter [Bacillus sp. Marseille-P3661]
MEIEIEQGHIQRLWTKNLIWILSIQVMSALAYHGYASLIPFIQSEFMLTKVEVGYMTSAMFLGSSIISIPSGVVTDRIGVRNTLTLFCLIMVGVLYIFLFTTSYIAIIALLVCFGVGYGGITPATNRCIMDEFPIQNRGTAMGIKQMGVPLGVVIATFILPLMAHHYSWNISLFVIGNILLLVSLAYFLKNQRDIKVDFAVDNPYAKLKEALLNKKVIVLGIVVSFYICVQVSVTTFIVIYLYQSIKFSLFVSTLCLGLVYCGGVLGRGIWGYISDNFFNRQRKKILTFIGIFSGFMLALLGFVNGMMPVVVVCVLSFLLGFTTQGWNGIFMMMLSESAKKSDVGLTSGVGLTITNFGAILGTPLAGLIVDLSGSYQIMWWSLAVILTGVSLLTNFLNIENN